MIKKKKIVKITYEYEAGYYWVKRNGCEPEIAWYGESENYEDYDNVDVNQFHFAGDEYALNENVITVIESPLKAPMFKKVTKTK